MFIYFLAGLLISLGAISLFLIPYLYIVIRKYESMNDSLTAEVTRTKNICGHLNSLLLDKLESEAERLVVKQESLTPVEFCDNIRVSDVLMKQVERFNTDKQGVEQDLNKYVLGIFCQHLSDTLKSPECPVLSITRTIDELTTDYVYKVSIKMLEVKK